MVNNTPAIKGISRIFKDGLSVLMKAAKLLSMFNTAQTRNSKESLTPKLIYFLPSQQPRPARTKGGPI